jgi:bifunctional UDP-N-acetylglucosamine pyrophosphorylase/glucosamine-1-phosphate N-acetyltransferase
MRLATAKRLMAEGVTIFRPDTCIIDSEVNVGPDTVIEPYVQLLGKTTIGSDSRIRSYSVIQNSRLGDNVTVRNGCILDSAEVADSAILGPYAHLRPESRIGEGAHVGNFVETKKTTIGKGSKANHLNYLGDTVIGANVNIGAGAITCNYDGVNKHPPPSATRSSSAPTPASSPPSPSARALTSPQAAPSPKTSPKAH